MACHRMIDSPSVALAIVLVALVALNVGTSIESPPEASGLQPAATEEPAEHEECAICMSDFLDERLNSVRLYCGHKFHSSCIKRWYQTGRAASSNCPTCRQRIRTKDGNPLTRSLIKDADYYTFVLKNWGLLPRRKVLNYWE